MGNSCEEQPLNISYSAEESPCADEDGFASGQSEQELEVEDSSEENSSMKVAEESDSSEDEAPPRNTVGNIPLEWYQHEDHIGYDTQGKKILKRKREDKIDKFLASVDDSKSWRKIFDEYNDEEVEIKKDQLKQIIRLIKGKTPDASVDPYPEYVDWFNYEDKGHPLSNAPEPKRRFVASKWEKMKVAKLIEGIRNGSIKFDEPEEEQPYYDLWKDEGSYLKRPGYIPAPKEKLPGHEESYRPPIEYIPTQEEINSYEMLPEEDRPKFIPRSYESYRKVPAYEFAIKERFDRCLDLYLCPRSRKKRLNVNLEDLKPKLPNKEDLRPYPSTCSGEFKGHTSLVTSLSVETSGDWLASGSSDGSVIIWNIETRTRKKILDFGERVQHVAWNPVAEKSILAVVLEHDVVLLNPGIGKEGSRMQMKELNVEQSEDGHQKSCLRWTPHDKYDGIVIKHPKKVSSTNWHFKGDYFATVMPSGHSKAVLLHQLSKKNSSNPFCKFKTLPVTATFHPSKKLFFVATQKFVQVYDLAKAQVLKTLETGLQEISCISIHPGGDNLIVGSKDGKICWFDLDLGIHPYKTIKAHPQGITSVAFHPHYPLFASSSDDGTAYVFHATVYSDLNRNPLIVPLKILRGHSNAEGRGVLYCQFDRHKPWLFTAGADSVIKLFSDSTMVP